MVSGIYWKVTFFFFLKVAFCFVVVANFLNFIALIISVSLDT